LASLFRIPRIEWFFVSFGSMWYVRITEGRVIINNTIKEIFHEPQTLQLMIEK